MGAVTICPGKQAIRTTIDFLFHVRFPERTFKPASGTIQEVKHLR
jgi:hypothetical protein